MNEQLDQLLAETLANRIISIRLWSYLADIAGRSEPGGKAAYIKRQLQMSVESVDLWSFEGHADPEKLKRMAKAALTIAFEGLVDGRSAGSLLQ